MIQVTDKIVSLMKLRSKENIHPCMLDFLVQFVTDNNIKGYYNGDHILTSQEPGYLTFKEYGLDYFKTAFLDLNQFEIMILTAYFRHD